MPTKPLRSDLRYASAFPRLDQARTLGITLNVLGDKETVAAVSSVTRTGGGFVTGCHQSHAPLAVPGEPELVSA